MSPPLRPRAAPTALLALCLTAATSAAGPSLRMATPEPRGETLRVKVALDGFLAGDDELRESLSAGLPVTVFLRWRLLESRDNWWDRELTAGLVSERIYCDLLEGSYTLFDARGRRAAVCADLAALADALAAPRTLLLPLPGPLPAGRRFVLELEARLEPVSDEELAALERWVAGDGGGRSGLLGDLTGRSEELLRRMAGFGGRSASARSPRFTDGG
jgi:hypothetical protein